MSDDPGEQAANDASGAEDAGSQDETAPNAAGEQTTTPGTAGISRRSALAAIGLTGLLGVGATTASADPQGQVGTASEPLVELHAEDVIASAATVSTDDDADGTTAVSGRATASGTAAETVGVEGTSDADADNAASPEVRPVGVRGKTTGDGVSFGVEGSTESPIGRGVTGFATSAGYEHDSFTSGSMGVMGVTDRSSDHPDLQEAVGVFGNSIATSGTGIGVVGRSESSSGVGVLGNDVDGGGTAVFANGDSFTDGDHSVTGGVDATAVTASTDDSTAGSSAIEGEATDTTNENYGVVGKTQSEHDSAAGVLGVADADSGLGQGVRGVAENGIAVEATNNADSGFQLGIWANIASDAGDAIQALASAESGEGSGVQGRCNSPDGSGVRGRGVATNGDAVGVLGQTDSPDGYGVYSEDDTRSDGLIEAGDGVVHEQRGEPTTDELADGDVMTYNSDGSDDHNAGDLVYAINDGGSILTQTIAEKSGAS